MSEKVISDYNGYDYKKEFWEDVDREYEDQADRMAIRKLLPKRMEKFADIGGGYGRLANEYLKRAHKVYLFDYSKTELKQAKEIYGDKIETKAGDIYKLPFKDDELDGLMMVRVTHHLKDMKNTKVTSLTERTGLSSLLNRERRSPTVCSTPRTEALCSSLRGKRYTQV